MCALWRIRKGGKSANRHAFGASLKPAKLTVLSANTLDMRRNCRHNHMLGDCDVTFVFIARLWRGKH
jgi:hypothetical protein